VIAQRSVEGEGFQVRRPFPGVDLALVIAGSLAGHDGPGVTHTPITYLHATVSPGARLAMPWPADYNALVYVLSGRGTVGPERRPLEEGRLAVFHHGDALTMHAADTQPANSPTGWEILVLGGLPINEPVARHGPFVMNTREEIITAFEDYEAGRLGQIPAEHLAHRTSADESL
jgi:redox-sensitive bicupin YhaK (pirin superfamily)